MKLFSGYKKQLLSLLFIIGIIFLSSWFFSYAQKAEEIKNKIEQRNIDISNLEKEIESYQKQLNTLSKSKNSLKNFIKRLDLNRKKLNADISITEKKIDKTNLKIKTLSSQILNKEDIILNDAMVIASGIRTIYLFEEKSLVEILFSKKKLAEIWNDINTIIYINDKIKNKILELQNVKEVLEYSKKETEEAKLKLIALKTKLADEKKIIDRSRQEKRKLLKETKNNEANYQKLLKNRLAKKEALEKELRDYESQLSFILDPSKLPESGVLSWPLDYVYVTQLFGRTVDAKRLYASGSHSGVDFRASMGTPVKAMSDGVVINVGDTDKTCPKASFGKWILIKYNNGLSSTYGHLSLIKAYKGQKVARGDIVAYSGNSGHTTGPHLHVTVYVSSAVKVKTIPSRSCVGKTLTQPLAAVKAYLDPMFYLPHLSKKYIK